MKKSGLLLIFILAFCAQNSSAQVPGYQGKRFSIGYNASSFFYYDFFTFEDGLSGIIESTKISYKTELSVNYTLSRKVLAGFSYYTAKQQYAFENGELQNQGQVFPQGKIAPCKLSIYELHFQFFRKNFIAPVGLYNQLSVGLVKYDLATSDHQLTVYDYSGSNPIIIPGPPAPYSCFKLGYAIGKTNPIGHHLYINTAAGINFFRGGDSIKIRSTPSEQNYILAAFNRSLRRENFFEIKIGLGWLAF